ncbi:MAG TPA: extracellular solute-binding protein [Candidatus Binatia bacterium]|nr:extracellular solute-binding protein [Candidatus Binatia bacterium]
MARLKRWLVLLLPLLAAGSLSNAQAAATDATLDAAKREGEVVFYASMNLAEANIMIAEFEKRYPFIKVKLSRAGSEKLLTRILTEARAKRVSADVIQTVEFSMHILKRTGVLARHIAPNDSLYPKNFKEEGFWTTVYYNPYVAAYNTRLVAPRMVPKTYDDLLDPKWKGKLMMEGTKADWFAGMLQIMGQERGLRYMRELAKQEPMLREGHELLAQLVAAGEGFIDINIPASSVDRVKEKGAPIDWIALGEAPAIMVGIGLASQAAHANAAKLFIDFALSREGQKLQQGFGRLVARTDLASEQPATIRQIKMVPVNPELAEKMNDYAKQLRTIFSG